MRTVYLDIPTSPIFATRAFSDVSNRLKAYRLYDQKIKLEDPYHLTFSPPRSYNRGLLYIAAALESLGARQTYYNSDYDEKYWSNGCQKDIARADIVLASVKTNNYPIIIDVLKKAKRLNPDIISVIGGPHPTALPADCLKNRAVDYVVLGEGDVTIKELYSYLSNGRPALRDISGLAYRLEGKIIINDARSLLNDLDELPLPAYHLLPGGLRSYHPYIDTSRGCVYQCGFCSGPRFWRRRIRTRSYRHFKRELDHISAHIGRSNFIHISDPMLGVTPKQLEILRQLGHAGTGLYFSCDIKANYVNTRLISFMKQCGIIVFSLGIESLSDQALKKVMKLCSAKIEKKAATIIKSVSGTYLKSYWITGLPGETKESMSRNTTAMYTLLKKGVIDQVCSHLLVPYPGTEFYTYPERFDLVIKHRDWIHYEGRSYPLTYRLKGVAGTDIYRSFLEAHRSELRYYEEAYPDFHKSIDDDPDGLKMSFAGYKGRLL